MKVIPLNQEGDFPAFEKIKSSIHSIENQQQCNSTEVWIELYRMLWQNERRTDKLLTLLNNKKLYVD